MSVYGLSWSGPIFQLAKCFRTQHNFLSACSKTKYSIFRKGRLISMAEINGGREYSVDIKDKKKICIEGNIGSGKTTLLDYFCKFPYVETTKEPVERWRNVRGKNALELMYQDPLRWSLTFQTYVQLTMFDIHTEPQKKKIKMMERSIFSAKYCFVENLYQSGKMPEIEYIILTEWFDHLVRTQNLDVDLIVYVKTKPELDHKRIMERSRSEEKGIPLEYLQKLHELHDDWLVKKKFPVNAPVYILNGDFDKEVMDKEYKELEGIISNWA